MWLHSNSNDLTHTVDQVCLTSTWIIELYFSPSNEDAKMEIMRLYEQSKALNAAQSRAVNNTDSGISSAPSSAGGSVSSTDTNHGGSDEDLIEFNSTWRHSSYDNWPPGKSRENFSLGSLSFHSNNRKVFSLLGWGNNESTNPHFFYGAKWPFIGEAKWSNVRVSI